MPNSTLYVVATPIGNKGDITLRALAVLKKADIIVCENSHHTALLLQHLNLLPHPHPKQQPPKNFIQDLTNRLLNQLQTLLLRTRPPKIITFKYHHQKNQALIQDLITQMTNKNLIVALLSTAGTPLISDPGLHLIQAAQEHDIPVQPIPGASALTAALMIAGFNANYFVFLGMLPKKTNQRQKWLSNWRDVPIKNTTYIAYVSKHQLLPALKDIYSVFGDIQTFVGNDLTKLNQQGYKSNITHLIDYFQTKPIKGEFVIVFSSK